MADVIFIAHFLLLLTFKICSGERHRTSLQEDDNSLDDEDVKEQSDLLEHSLSRLGIQKRFKCYFCENAECVSPQLCHDAVVCWKSRVREKDGVERVTRGCSKSDDEKMFTCTKKSSQVLVDCCYSDLCNNGPFPVLENLTAGTEGEDYLLKLILAILGPIIGLGIITCGIFFCLLARKTRAKRPSASKRNKLLIDAEMGPSILHFTSTSPASANYQPHELRATAAGDSTLKEYLDGRSLTSGSGSGLPLLVQRTLAKQVALVECLGSGGGGGFGGEVWRGIWHGENVAVKIYFSRDELAWTRETEVYSQLLPSRHDNILGYVGSDMTSRASCTQLWLVTHYHELGSLFDNLSHSPHPLTHHQSFNICLSIVNGLLYLHTEIHGTKGKPAMAHRNIKSKNILVKNNGSCVIADFTLAVTQDRLMADTVDLRQGTKRYMCPEFLEQTVNLECLESFRRADIYSLGLIFWEVCRRCVSNGVALEYAPPFYEWLSSSSQDPSIEEMRKLVSLDQRRPPLPNRWHSDATLAGMGKLMRECWHGKPAARLPILRVKKTLVKLAANDSRVHLPLD
ncbi:activin receptor type-1-like [Leptopilina heterotoma]|uniref:activin receptor type-1-like n=1 Tax=Leptopilina heterotoma TaxID=63436 RepID=UPI001CA91EBF|nr:activin receptor type-1-like [Leptopilina heterotoma]